MRLQHAAVESRVAAAVAQRVDVDAARGARRAKERRCDRARLRVSTGRAGDVKHDHRTRRAGRRSLDALLNVALERVVVLR